MRGSRVKDIVRELQGERVDIIKWSDDLKEYVKEALKPAQIQEIKIDKTKKKIEVIVPDDQLSIGIGKHGQNIRLASKLIGWEMDIRGKEEKAKAPKEEGEKKAAAPEKEGAPAAAKEPAAEEAPLAAAKLSDLEGVGPKIEKILIAAGYDTVEKIKGLTIEDLTKLDGVGKKTAEKILRSAKG
jgi:N utilization substance protein A